MNFDGQDIVNGNGSGNNFRPQSIRSRNGEKIGRVKIRPRETETKAGDPQGPNGIQPLSPVEDRRGINPDKARKGIEELYGMEFANKMMEKKSSKQAPTNDPAKVNDRKPPTQKKSPKSDGDRRPSTAVPSFELPAGALRKDANGEPSASQFGTFGKRNAVPSVAGPVSGSFVFGTSILGNMDANGVACPSFQFNLPRNGKPAKRDGGKGDLPKVKHESSGGGIFSFSNVAAHEAEKKGPNSTPPESDALKSLRNAYSEAADSPGLSGDGGSGSKIFFQAGDGSKQQNNRYAQADMSEDSFDSEATKNDSSIADAISKLSVKDENENLSADSRARHAPVEEVAQGVSHLNLNQGDVDHISKTMKNLKVGEGEAVANNAGMDSKVPTSAKSAAGKTVRQASLRTKPLGNLNIGREKGGAVENGGGFLFTANAPGVEDSSKVFSATKQSSKTPKVRKTKSVRQSKKAPPAPRAEGSTSNENTGTSSGSASEHAAAPQASEPQLQEAALPETAASPPNPFVSGSFKGSDPPRQEGSRSGVSSDNETLFRFFGLNFPQNLNSKAASGDANPFSSGVSSPLDLRSSVEPIQFKSAACPEPSKQFPRVSPVPSTSPLKAASQKGTPESQDSVFMSTKSFATDAEHSPATAAESSLGSAQALSDIQHKMQSLSMDGSAEGKKADAQDAGAESGPLRAVFGLCKETGPSGRYSSGGSKPETSQNAKSRAREESPPSSNSYMSAQDSLNTPESALSSPGGLKFTPGLDSSVSKSRGSPGLRRSHRLRGSVSKSKAKSPAKAKHLIAQTSNSVQGAAAGITSEKENVKEEPSLAQPVDSSGGASHSSALQAEQSCEKWRSKGNVAYNQGTFPKAEDFYGRGVQCVSQFLHIPRCSRAAMLCWSNRAATRMHLSRMRDALKDCSRAMEVDPAFHRVRLRAASCHLAVGNTKEATSLLHDCLTLFKDGNEADPKLVPEAQEGLRKVRLVEEHRRKVDMYFKGSLDARAALKHATEALALSPYSEELWEKKAGLLLQMREFEEVVKMCEATLEKARKNAEDSAASRCQAWRLCMSGRARLGQGRLEESLKLLSQALDGMSEGEEMQAVRAYISGVKELTHLKTQGNEAFLAGRHQEAVDQYSAALSVSLVAFSRPFMAVCFCNRAAANQALGLLADSIADCSRAIALEPSYSKAISRRAAVYELVRDQSQASADLARLISQLEAAGKGRSEDASKARDRLRKVEEEGRRGLPVDHYKLLGVEVSCSAADIKKAFRKAALRHHPDKASQFLPRPEEHSMQGVGVDYGQVGEEACREADRLFKLIGEGYAVLSDPEKRQQYDAEEQMRKQRSGSAASGNQGSTAAAAAGYAQTYGRTGRRPRDNWDPEWDIPQPAWNAEAYSRRARGYHAADTGVPRRGSRFGGYNWDDL